MMPAAPANSRQSVADTRNRSASIERPTSQAPHTPSARAIAINLRTIAKKWRLTRRGLAPSASRRLISRRRCGHRAGDSAVGADRGEQQRDRGERRREQRRRAARHQAVVDPRVHRPHVGDGQVRIDGADGRPQRLRQLVNRLTGAHDDEDVAVEAMDEREVDRALGVAVGDRALFDGADDADDAECVGRPELLRSLETLPGRARCARASNARQTPGPRRTSVRWRAHPAVEESALAKRVAHHSEVVAADTVGIVALRRFVRAAGRGPGP